MKNSFRIGIRLNDEIQIYTYMTKSSDLDVVRKEMKQEFHGENINPILILVPNTPKPV